MKKFTSFRGPNYVYTPSQKFNTIRILVFRDIKKSGKINHIKEVKNIFCIIITPKSY